MKGVIGNDMVWVRSIAMESWVSNVQPRANSLQVIKEIIIKLTNEVAQLSTALGKFESREVNSPTVTCPLSNVVKARAKKTTITMDC